MFSDVQFLKAKWPCLPSIVRNCTKKRACPARAPDLYALIKKGDHVKLDVHNTEKFWVYVTKVDGNKITGIVNQILRFWHVFNLKHRQEITFERRHIWELMRPDQMHDRIDDCDCAACKERKEKSK